MHLAIVLLISFGIILLIALGIYFFTRETPRVIPGQVTDISLTERNNEWIISWARPTTGSSPIGYIYVIQGVSVANIITQGSTSDLFVTLNRSSYTPSEEYLITIIPRNAAGDGPTSSFVFTAPILV